MSAKCCYACNYHLCFELFAEVFHSYGHDRYEKQIRYESRKVRAETRIRIKGRFAKMDRRDTATR